MITIFAALTSKFGGPLYPAEVLQVPPEGGVRTATAALLRQVRSIDKRRLNRRRGALRPATIARVGAALSVSFGLI